MNNVNFNFFNKAGRLINKAIDKCCNYKFTYDENKCCYHTNTAGYIVYIMLLLFLVIILWLIFTKIDILVIAPGQIVTTDPEIYVQPVEESIIRSINVRVGNYVKKGDILITLDPTVTNTKIFEIRQQIDAAEAKIERLKSEINHVDNFVDEISGNLNMSLQKKVFLQDKEVYTINIQKFKISIKQIQENIQSYKRKIKIYTQEVRSSTELLQMKNKLFKKGFVSRSDIIKAEQEVENFTTKLEQAKSERIAVENNLNNQEKMLEEYIANWPVQKSQELIDTVNQKKLLKQQLKQASLYGSLTKIKAESNAIVLSINNISIGSVIEPNQTILKLVPMKSPLEVELDVSSKDIGWLKKGNQVQVHLESFSFQRYGEILGKIIAISPDSMHLKEGVTDLIYKVRVKIVKNKLHSVPNYFRLLPGMSLVGNIIVGKRSIISYFMDPLKKAFYTSLSEPS